MAQAFRSSTGVGNSASPIAIGIPAGTVSGDVLVFGGITSNAGVFTNPGGWTLLHDQTVGAIRAQVWYKQAAGEPASYNWAFAGGGNGAGRIITITGARATIDAQSVNVNATAIGNMTGVSITTTINNPMMFWMGARPSLAVAGNIQIPTSQTAVGTGNIMSGAANTTPQMNLCCGAYGTAGATPAGWYSGTVGGGQTSRSVVSNFSFLDALPDAQPLLFCEV